MDQEVTASASATHQHLKPIHFQRRSNKVNQLGKHDFSSRHSSFGSKSRRLGGIAFNKVLLGRKRIVHFLVTNPGPDEFILLHFHISSPEKSASAGKASDTMNSSTRSLQTSSLGGPVFCLVSNPPLPLNIPPGHEIECAIAFCPREEGFFSAVLEITAQYPQPKQLITLHGQAEHPTNPQQLLYEDNDESSRTSFSFSEQICNLSGISYPGFDEDLTGMEALWEEGGTHFQPSLESAFLYKRSALHREGVSHLQNTTQLHTKSASSSHAFSALRDSSSQRSLDSFARGSPSASRLTNTSRSSGMSIHMEELNELEQRLCNLEARIHRLFEGVPSSSPNLALEHRSSKSVPDHMSLSSSSSASSHPSATARRGLHSLIREDEDEEAPQEQKKVMMDQLLKPSSTPSSPISNWQEVVSDSPPADPVILSKSTTTTHSSTPSIRTLYKDPDSSSWFWK